MCSLYVTYSHYLSSFNVYISTVPQNLQILATPLMEFINIWSACVRDGWEGRGGRMGGRGTEVGVGGGKG